MHRTLIVEIFNNIWAIDKRYADSYAPVISSILKGEKIDIDFSAERKKYQAFAISGIDSSTTSVIKDAAPGSIAVIPIVGAIMKRDQFCGPVGTQTIMDSIKQADANPNISAIILKIDSPGGMVDGTQELADAIKQTTKPIVAYADGLMASAAMWIGSAANEIIASSETANIGSIGTMISFADMQPMYEALGVKFHEIYASQSIDKNKIFSDALKGDYSSIQKEMLDPTNKIFMNAIKTNRKGKIDLTNENVLTGKIYMASDAVKYGLADSIGNFDYAISRANELANSNSINNNSKQYEMKIKESWTAIKSYLSAKFSTEVVEGTELTVDHIEKMNEELGAVAAVKAELQTAKETIESLNKEKGTLEASVTEWKEKAEAFGKLAGEKPTAPKKDADKIESTMPAFVDAESEHMKSADEMFS